MYNIKKIVPLLGVCWLLYACPHLVRAEPDGHCDERGNPPNPCAVWDSEKCAWVGEEYTDACGGKHCAEPDPAETACCKPTQPAEISESSEDGIPYNPDLNICCAGQLISKSDIMGATPSTKVGLLGVTEAANGVLDGLESLANGAVSDVNIDSRGVREVILSLAEGKGWTAEFIAQLVTEVIDKAVERLNEAKDGAAAALVSSAKGAISGRISSLEPKAKFQADVTYYRGCCEQAQWAGGAANREGKSSISAFGEFQFKFAVGASAVAQANIDFLLKLRLEGSFSITGFNPVRPTTGSGPSFTITATPTFELKRSVSVGGGTLLQLTFGGTVTDNGTLRDVSGTLECPES